MASASDSEPSIDRIDMGTAGLPGRNVLEISTLRLLSQRSDIKGLIRFGTHLSLIVSSWVLIGFAMPHWYLLIPAMVLCGITLVTMFAPMHECVHRTAFATPWLNEAFGWLAGLLSFYNFTFYRYYHTWHHRYTQDPERDPELMDAKPQSMVGYIFEISAIGYWAARPLMFARMALGQSKKYPFVPVAARRKIAISAGVQLSIYIAAAASIAMGYPEALYYFYLPAVLGQPVLRAIVLAEHTACSHDENGLTNTRTTLTSFPIRLLMWNMPFHTEHHLYPSIPFHQLPRAHTEIHDKLVHLSPSYIAANRTIIQSFAAKRQDG